MFSLYNLCLAAAVFFAAWFLICWKARLEKWMISKVPDRTTKDILGKLFTAAVWFIASLLILQLFGLDIAPLLAFGGIGAAALGFASKDMISNFYGGLAIYLTRPFVVSDQIELPQRKLMGTVEKIGWYFTTIRDTAKMPYYIPNAVFTTELVVNQSRMTHRYIDEIIWLRYKDAAKLQPAIEEIRAVIQGDGDIDADLPVYVFIKACAEAALRLEVRAYAKTTSYDEAMEIKQKILLRIFEILHRYGIEIGVPASPFVIGK